MKHPLWAISFAVSVIAVCVTIYNVTVDPRVSAMTYCTSGFPNAETQIACAREIWGSDQ